MVKALSRKRQKADQYTPSTTAMPIVMDDEFCADLLGIQPRPLRPKRPGADCNAGDSIGTCTHRDQLQVRRCGRLATIFG